jgi:aminoglycoside phosphotransferase (APT) family kinase protein
MPPPALVDWQLAAIGDPAYDFCILFRGGTKLFGIGGGPRQALEAYREAGGPEVSERRIAAYEALMHVRWQSEGDPQEQNTRARMRKLCRRALSAEG